LLDRLLSDDLPPKIGPDFMSVLRDDLAGFRRGCASETVYRGADHRDALQADVELSRERRVKEVCRGLGLPSRLISGGGTVMGGS